MPTFVYTKCQKWERDDIPQLADHPLQDDLILLPLLGLSGQRLTGLSNQARKPLEHDVLANPSQNEIHDAQGKYEHLEVPADGSKVHQTYQPDRRTEDHVSRERKSGSNRSNKGPYEQKLAYMIR